MVHEDYTLNNGVKIPAVGLGTWQSAPGRVAAAIEYALLHGYRLIDCAYCYGNEDEVGQGIKAAMAKGVKRSDFFVVSKVWATYTSRVALGLDKSLAKLGLDYVDLYLVHWPLLMNPDGNDDRFPTLPSGERDIIRSWSHVDTWKQMEALLPTGKARAVGVCNYSKRYLEELLAHCSVVPAVDQIENHPALPQQEVVDLCHARGIHVMAFSPLGSTGGPLMKVAPVVAIAAKHDVSPATVLLSYHNARGSTVLAKSTHADIIDANKKIIDLDAADMKDLDDYSHGLVSAGKVQRFVYPPFGVDFGFPDKS